MNLILLCCLSIFPGCWECVGLTDTEIYPSNQEYSTSNILNEDLKWKQTLCLQGHIIRISELVYELEAKDNMGRFNHIFRKLKHHLFHTKINLGMPVSEFENPEQFAGVSYIPP